MNCPFGRGKRFGNVGGVANQAIGGWKLSGVFQAQTGDPVFLTSSNQGSSYPFKTGDPYAPGGTANTATQPQFNCATKTHSLQQWFNPCAFANPPQAVEGAPNPGANQINVNDAGLLPAGPRGRVGVVGPGFNRLDASLFKSFAIPYRESALQLRVDGFNVLNHPEFGNPGSSLTGTTGQAITSTRFNVILPSQRVLQVAARFSF